MSKPSSRHLTHDFPAYMGLSLHELLLTGSLGMLAVILISLFFGFVFGRPGIFTALGIVLGFIISARILPKIVARKKASKPQGYVKKVLVQKASALRLIKSPYLKHAGCWRKDRILEVKNDV